MLKTSPMSLPTEATDKTTKQKSTNSTSNDEKAHFFTDQVYFAIKRKYIIMTKAKRI